MVFHHLQVMGSHPPSVGMCLGRSCEERLIWNVAKKHGPLGQIGVDKKRAGLQELFYI